MTDTEIKQENTAAAPEEDFELEWLDDFSEAAAEEAPKAAPVKAEEPPAAHAKAEAPAVPAKAEDPPKPAAEAPAETETPKAEEPPKPAEEAQPVTEPPKAEEPPKPTEEEPPKAAELPAAPEPPAVMEPPKAAEAPAEPAPQKAEVPAAPAHAPKKKKKKKKSAAAKRRQRERERARRKKSRMATILMVVCVIVAIGSAAMVIRAVYYYQHAGSTYDGARANAVSTVQPAAPPAPIEVDPVAEPEPEEETRPEGAVLDINFEELKAVNPDVVGWLHVPALDLSYPVMQGEDNEYYLTHTLEDEYNPLGSIFMECTNLPDFSHGNTLLYGHNTVDGTMFGRLREFGTDPSLRENEPYFYVYQADGRIGKYKIYSYYSVYKESDSFSWFTDDESYDYYVNMTKNLSIEPIEADFSERHNLVTLSTCFGASGTPYRFLVHGVRE